LAFSLAVLSSSVAGSLAAAFCVVVGDEAVAGFAAGVCWAKMLVDSATPAVRRIAAVFSLVVMLKIRTQSAKEGKAKSDKPAYAKAKDGCYNRLTDGETRRQAGAGT